MEQVSETKYPVFTPGQPLKSDDLNQLVKYFAGGDENTRVFFIGRGIFYGLMVGYNANSNTVSIDPGAGLSSNGIVMAFELKTVFRGVQPRLILIGEKSVAAHVLTAEAGQSDKLATLMRDPKSVVLLYFSSSDTTVSSCLHPADQNGTTRTEKVEAVIISSDDLKTEIDKWKGNQLEERIIKEIPEAFLHRFGYHPIGTSGRSGISFDSFTSWPEMVKSFDLVCKDAEPLIGKSYIEIYNEYWAQVGIVEHDNPFINLSADLSALRSSITGEDSVVLPYYYDYLKDLIAAGTEFLEAATESSSYYPKKDAFRDYISLGKADAVQDNPYRMEYYKLPIDYAGKDSLEKAKALFKRMISLADVSKQFIVADVMAATSAITPSTGINVPLSRGPISFYLSEKQDLKKYWNHDAIRLKKTNSIPGLEDGKDHEALLQDMDAYNFFKIKGHAGKPLNESRATIEQMRAELNLPFDIRTLFIGDNSFADAWIQQHRTSFSDLDLLLLNIVGEIQCGSFCGDGFEKALFGSSVGDVPAMFEALITFFKDAPKDRWNEWAEETCKRICKDRRPECCPAYLRTLYQLTVEYLRRKTELLDEIIFHRFAKKHPGLEHNAGAPKGGTLFLVCQMGQDFNQKNPSFLRIMRQSEKQSEEVRSFIASSFGVPIVMADFCLPYVCCSQSPSVNVEISITFPEADFEETDRVEIRDEGGPLIGVSLFLANKSKSATEYVWTLHDTNGDEIEQKTTNDLSSIQFDLYLKDGKDFTVRLVASRGTLKSEKEALFAIEDDGPVVELRKKGFLAAAHELETEDKNVARTGWFQEGVAFMSPKGNKKNFDKDFEKFFGNVKSRFDKINDETRKKSAVALLTQVTLFYLDRLVEHTSASHTEEANEALKAAVGFINKNSVPAVSIHELWRSDEIKNAENEELIAKYNAMIS